MAFFDMFTIAGVISAIVLGIVIVTLTARCDCKNQGC